MQQYNITGMSCAACSTRVEKAVSKLDGVSSCSVNLLTNSMSVDGTANQTDIIKAVENAGYGASLKGSKKDNSTEQNTLTDKETPKLLKRLIASVIFLIALMYVSMGHTMWGFPLPNFLENNHIAIGILQMLLSAIIMVINQKFFISGFKGLLHKAPNMDTLVSMGSMASFIYSVCMLFVMTDAQLKGDTQGVMHCMHQFYFESAGMILTLITVGKMLEARSKGKTTDALKSLMKLAPKTATVLVNGEEKVISATDVKINDIFVVKPGESIAVDAVVIDGVSAVNESALTGESIPVDKAVDDTVSAGTINTTGYLKCKATRVGQDTTLSQIIKMVSDASASKAPIAKIADKVSGVFVPAVIIIALVTFVIWMITGATVGFSLARAISVLVISCPCALGLATPVAIMVGSGKGAKNGILFKTAESLEEAGKVQIVALDKTGTITKGEPVVTDIIPADNITEEELLTYAYSLEKQSEHPLAKAIVKKAKDVNIILKEAVNFKALTGNGVMATIEDNTIYGGSYSFIKEKVNLDNTIDTLYQSLAKKGKTPLFFSKENNLLGVIAVADTIKEDSEKAVKQLQNMGIKVVMLTGDNKETANAIGKETGVDDVIAGVLPDGKEAVIRNLKKQGKVMMVGDGINDAPALTSADIGVAIGAGADVAVDSADIVLMKSSLIDVPATIRLSRATLKIIHENLFWAFIYNVIGIPLAAGAFIALLGWQLNPMFGAAAMSLSSFCVVTNALRLNFVKVHDFRKDKKIKIKNKKELKQMTKTMNITGMMCPHCSGRVKTVLEQLEQVAEAEVSHETGTAVVTLNADIANDVLKSTVEAQGYKVTDIK